MSGRFIMVNECRKQYQFVPWSAKWLSRLFVDFMINMDNSGFYDNILLCWNLKQFFFSQSPAKKAVNCPKRWWAIIGLQTGRSQANWCLIWNILMKWYMLQHMIPKFKKFTRVEPRLPPPPHVLGAMSRFYGVDHYKISIEFSICT